MIWSALGLGLLWVLRLTVGAAVAAMVVMSLWRSLRRLTHWLRRVLAGQ